MGRVWASTRADSNGKKGYPTPFPPPTSGGISAALSTPAAKTSIETLTVKGGILAGGYGLGKVLESPPTSKCSVGRGGVSRVSGFPRYGDSYRNRRKSPVRLWKLASLRRRKGVRYPFLFAAFMENRGQGKPGTDGTLY